MRITPTRLLPSLAVAACLATLPAEPTRAAEGNEAWQAPEGAQKQKSPLRPTEAHLAAGKKIYTESCANCHGTLGKGDGKASPYLAIKPRDLTSEEAAAETDGALFWKISEGRIPMPDFGSKLSDEQRWQVILHLRQLQMTAGQSEAPKSK